VRRLPLPGLTEGARTLPLDAGRYVARVLRLRAGEPLEVFEPRAGLVASARITRVHGDEVDVAVAAPRAEPPLRPLVLVQGYPKGDKLGDIVRDATELGATLIVPAVCERSVARPDASKSQSKAERLATIAAEAARQCGRARAPEIAPPMPLGDALALARAHVAVGFVLWERATIPLGPALAAAADGAAFVVGPEGGLSDAEVERARELGYEAHSLGAIVLRTETAATAVLGAYRVLVG
jgi:16S rRNA (uracil1498-N3)-methyltransferase